MAFPWWRPAAWRRMARGGEHAALDAMLDWLGALNVERPLRLSRPSRSGRRLRIQEPEAFWATLSGLSPPYDWTSADDPARTGGAAYPYNGESGLGGRTVWLRHKPTSGDYRFEVVSGATSGPPPPCPRPWLCVVLRNTCSGHVAGWTITIRDPSGAVIASCVGAWTCCVDLVAIGASPGTYTATASKTIDLSAFGDPTAPSAYTETFSTTFAVADICDAPQPILDVRESFWVINLDCTCHPGASPGEVCAVDTEVTLTCELGSWTGDASTTKTIVFSGFDPFDPAFDTIHWTATVVSDSIEGTCSETVPRCGPGGQETGPGVGGFIEHLLGDPPGPYVPGGCMHPKDGYFCACCSAPLPIDLFYTDGSGASIPISYITDPADPNFGQWYGEGDQPSAAPLTRDSYGGCIAAPTAAARVWVTCSCVGDKLVFHARKHVLQCFNVLHGAAGPCTTGPDADLNNLVGLGDTDPIDCDPIGIAATGALSPFVGGACDIVEIHTGFSVTN
jgi:hypothetical protein